MLLQNTKVSVTPIIPVKPVVTDYIPKPMPRRSLANNTIQNLTQINICSENVCAPRMPEITQSQYLSSRLQPEPIHLSSANNDDMTYLKLPSDAFAISNKHSLDNNNLFPSTVAAAAPPVQNPPRPVFQVQSPSRHGDPVQSPTRLAEPIQVPTQPISAYRNLMMTSLSSPSSVCSQTSNRSGYGLTASRPISLASSSRDSMQTIGGYCPSDQYATRPRPMVSRTDSTCSSNGSTAMSESMFSDYAATLRSNRSQPPDTISQANSSQGSVPGSRTGRQSGRRIIWDETRPVIGQTSKVNLLKDQDDVNSTASLSTSDDRLPNANTSSVTYMFKKKDYDPGVWSMLGPLLKK